MKKSINFQALYSALDTRRVSRKMTWKQISDEMSVSPSLFSRMAAGKGCDSETYMTLTAWLETRPEEFVDGDLPEYKSKPETLDRIAAHLRADKNLNPESAEAIETVIAAAYEQLSARRAAN